MMSTLRPLLLVLMMWPGTVFASSLAVEPSCMDAAAAAEARHGVPDKLLQTIALVESGRMHNDVYIPWPWTTNVDAKSRYFPTKGEMTRFVKDRLYAGDTSIDIGCFQINTRWHGEHFTSIDDMANPAVAAEYAATFLSGLKEEFGDWDIAARKYHSRSPVFGNKYGKKLAAARQALTKAPKRKQQTPTISIAPPPLRDARPLGGVTLAVFANAKPMLAPATGSLLIQGAPPNEH